MLCPRTAFGHNERRQREPSWRTASAAARGHRWRRQRRCDRGVGAQRRLARKRALAAVELDHNLGAFGTGRQLRDAMACTHFAASLSSDRALQIRDADLSTHTR
jgi:hypothetical protein